MKVGAVVICRYNSSRLPGKILKEINGKPILQHIITRLRKIEDLNVVVGTSIEETDDPIANYCRLNGIDYYRGALDNVADRFLKTAKAFDFDYALRVNGDNLFIDIDAMQEMISIAETQEFDFISNVEGRTFPYGMSIEILSVKFYEKVFQLFHEEEHYEHVTIYLYKNESGKYYHFKNTTVPSAKGLKIAVDTVEDFNRAKSMAKDLKYDLSNYNLEEITKLIIKYQA